MKNDNATIHRIVSRIPRGRVATYGQIARLAGIPRQARRVGYAMRRLPEGSAVPWQRVVNASGEISKRGDPAGEAMQAQMLRLEGIVFHRGKISLDRYQWRPKG
jgi:methylated-DNA-protein-cysteine methyltransferase-like protein